MRAPQIIYLGLTLAGLLQVATEHGKPRDPYDFWYSLVATTITLCLLWWGGFFK